MNKLRICACPIAQGPTVSLRQYIICVYVSVYEKKQEHWGGCKLLKQKKKLPFCLNSSCLGPLDLPRSLKFQVSHPLFCLSLLFATSLYWEALSWILGMVSARFCKSFLTSQCFLFEFVLLNRVGLWLMWANRDNIQATAKNEKVNTLELSTFVHNSSKVFIMHKYTI